MSRQAYRGPNRKLVLAFDVGTTASGISYSILEPGKVPQIKPVTRFPAHEHVSGGSKIPTIIYYDRTGEIKAVGAEALREGVLEQAEDEEWTKAELFKLHLRNKIGAKKNVGNDIPPLPANKSVVDVFADFLAYLLFCVEKYIKDTHANGPTFWESVKSEIDFVLSHPNGWEGTQQQDMRRAAAQAKLIPDTPTGHARLTFVTEGEAILHYSIQNGLPAGAMSNGDGVVIVDAGRGTINISSYRLNSGATWETYEEVAAPQCHFHGSVFVSILARMFLDDFLADSPFYQDLEHIVRCFDRTTKVRFRNSQEFQYIKFGSTRDNDEKFNIRFGQLKLRGSDVATFFEPSINCVVKAVMDQRKNAHKPISHVVLAGGFAASDWLYNNVKSQLTPKGLNVVRPDSHVNKAVSDGLVAAYLDHFVKTRISKVAYGIFCHIPFEPTPSDHQERIKNTFVSAVGSNALRNLISYNLFAMPLKAYSGPKQKLALAFDVGYTFSGISYSILEPGKVTHIKPVTRFPAHEHISGASKIPTVIYYDRAGKVKAVGAEALREGILEQAEDEQWTKAEWFKIHLRNGIGVGKNASKDIPPLPTNKSVIDVFADFLAYLLVCAEKYIKDTHANGPTFWESVKNEIDFVLSHPNGWEGTQQQDMRRAAVQAKLIPDTPTGHARLNFITEGEAILHYSIQNNLLAGAMSNDDGVVIVDAGRGTIDISSYYRNTRAPQERFEEVAAPQCHFHGSAFVSLRARLFLNNFLAGSPFHEDLDHIVRCFDRTTKLRFRNSHEFQYIKFGSTRDNDEKCNIRFGQVKLQGSDVATFFEPSISCVVKAVMEQRKNTNKPISHVVLVGGFTASDWLYNNVKSQLTPKGLNVVRCDNHVNRAVSDGLLSVYIDRMVRTRVSKVRPTYGDFCHIPFEPAVPDHQQRINNAYVSASGSKLVSDAFAIILHKNTQVTETKEFRKSFFRESENKDGFKSAEFHVWCYRGQLDEPKWKDQDTKRYTKLCTITVDLSHLPLQAHPNGTGGGTFFRLDYEIVLLFGLTELKAQVVWKEKNVEKRTATKIVYDPDTANDVT